MTRLTTIDLIQSVRSLLDEDSQFAINDDTDILPSLNRAQDNASAIIATMYESPLLKTKDITISGPSSEFAIPKDALEERIEAVEFYTNSYHYPLKRIDFRELADYETTTPLTIPTAYCVISDVVRIVPALPNVAKNFRIWYLQDPPALVKEHGRVTLAGPQYVVLDSVSPDVSSVADELASYVNVIDGATGNIRGSFQVASVTGQRVTFRTTPSRAVVQGRQILGATTGLEIGPDDYLCPILGSCITYLKKPLSNYLIQYALSELTTKLGGDNAIEARALKQLEQMVERSWAGRENTNRVRPTSNYWNGRMRNWRIFS